MRWNVCERYRGRKQNWARKLSDCDTDMIPVKGKRQGSKTGYRESV